MAHEYKTHFVGASGSGRAFCGIPLGNFPVTVVFETVTCRQCVRRYFSHGTVTGRNSRSEPEMQNITPRTPMGRQIRKMAALGLGYGAGPQSFPKAPSGDPYLELARAYGLVPLDTSPSWPTWLPAQDEEA